MTTRPGDWQNRARSYFDPAFLPYTKESIARNGLTPSIEKTKSVIEQKERQAKYLKVLLKDMPPNHWERPSTNKIIADLKSEILFLTDRLEELYHLRVDAEQAVPPKKPMRVLLSYPSQRTSSARAAANRARAQAIKAAGLRARAAAAAKIASFNAARAQQASIAARIAANRAAARIRLTTRSRAGYRGTVFNAPYRGPILNKPKFVPRTTTIYGYRRY